MSDLLAIVVDGPCEGSYEIKRATRRMVFTVGPDGRRFALDELGDVVEAGEQAYVYEAQDGIGWMCGRGPGLPCRTVTFEYSGRLDATTGEYLEASEAERAKLRGDARSSTLAWARRVVEEQFAAAKPARPLPPLAEVQEALF